MKTLAIPTLAQFTAVCVNLKYKRTHSYVKNIKQESRPVINAYDVSDAAFLRFVGRWDKLKDVGMLEVPNDFSL